jgi:prevent-host-death family protein
MVRIGIRELRDNLTATIRRVRAGEAFEVTHDGEPVAVLSPVKRTRLEELIASGDITPAKRPLDLSRPRYPVQGGGLTSQQILDELRADH